MPPREDWPSLANSKAAGLYLGGICGRCTPPRDITISIDDLIVRYGPDAKTKEVADRIVCKVCGSRVGMVLAPYNTGPRRDAG